MRTTDRRGDSSQFACVHHLWWSGLNQEAVVGARRGVCRQVLYGREPFPASRNACPSRVPGYACVPSEVQPYAHARCLRVHFLFFLLHRQAWKGVVSLVCVMRDDKGGVYVRWGRLREGGDVILFEWDGLERCRKSHGL